MLKLGLYEHYRGLKYEVIGLSRHSETFEELVVYRKLYDDYSLWVRPYKMFIGKVEVEGKLKDRFRYIRSIFEFSPEVKSSGGFT